MSQTESQTIQNATEAQPVQQLLAPNDIAANFVSQYGHRKFNYHGRQLMGYEITNCGPMMLLASRLGESAIHNHVLPYLVPEEQENEEKPEDAEALELEKTETKEHKDELDVPAGVEKPREKEEPILAKAEPAKEDVMASGNQPAASYVSESGSDLQKQITSEPVTDKPAAVSGRAESPLKSSFDDVKITPSVQAESIPALRVEALPKIAGPAPEPETPVVTLNEVKLPVTEAPNLQPAEFEPRQIELEEVVLDTEPETYVEPLENIEQPAEHEFQIPNDEVVEPVTARLLKDESTEFSDEDFPIPQLDKHEPLLSVPVEDVEETIELMSTKIEVLEGEEAEAIHQTLDEITEASNKLEVLAEEEASEMEVREELENLFAKLFDQLDIQYTPQLLSAYATLALNNQLEEVIDIDTKRLAELNYEIPKEPGTHEFITKLLASFTKLKKALQQAYLIGKSALHLYTLKYDTYAWRATRPA